MKYLLIILLISSCSMTSKKDKAVQKRFKLLKQEAELGKRVAVRILKKYPRLENAKSQTYISNLGRSIVHRLGRQELYYYFAVVDTKEKKSFAAPGGFVFVTSGLIRSLKTEAQLVGILSREISHVNHKHGMVVFKKEKDMKKAADLAFKMIDENKYQGKQIKRAENDAVMGLVSMKYDPKQFVPVSHQKKYIKKLTKKFNSKVSQSGSKRFSQLKTRI